MAGNECGQSVWRKNFVIPMLLGLGNHDYENNLNDCWMNRCIVDSVLGFVNYTKEMNLAIDINGSDPISGGSLSYATHVCSGSGKPLIVFEVANRANMRDTSANQQRHRL